MLIHWEDNEHVDEPQAWIYSSGATGTDGNSGSVQVNETLTSRGAETLFEI